MRNDLETSNSAMRGRRRQDAFSPERHLSSHETMDVVMRP